MNPILHDTLAEYGKQLGLAALAPNAQGAAQLLTDSGRTIGVEWAEPEHPGTSASAAEEVLVFLRQPVPGASEGLFRRALAKAHFSQGGAYPVQLGLLDDPQGGPGLQLTVLTRVPIRQFTPQTMGHAVDFLTRWLDAL